MRSPQLVRRFPLGFAAGALVLLLSQPGCNEQAPATEPERRIEAQKKRAETLKGESGVALPAKTVKAVRRR
jgi:hypothetical protein